MTFEAAVCTFSDMLFSNTGGFKVAHVLFIIGLDYLSALALLFWKSFNPR